MPKAKPRPNPVAPEPEPETITMAPEVVEHEIVAVRNDGLIYHGAISQLLDAFGARPPASVFGALLYVAVGKRLLDPVLYARIEEVVAEAMAATDAAHPDFIAEAARIRDELTTNATEAYLNCDCEKGGKP